MGYDEWLEYTGYNNPAPENYRDWKRVQYELDEDRKDSIDYEVDPELPFYD